MGLSRSAVACAIAVAALAACILSFSSTTATLGTFNNTTHSSSSSSNSSTGFLGVHFTAQEEGEQQQQQEDGTQHVLTLQRLREQLLQNVTHQAIQQQLQGAKLSKGVGWKLARQLLVDKALLQHSSREGHAAMRTRAIRAHYSSSSNIGDAGGDETSSNSSSSSRGILIVGGSRTHLGNAYMLLRMLREHLKCELPIEVVYYGRRELDSEAAKLIVNFAAQQAAAGKPSVTLVDGAAVHRQYIGQLPPHPDVALTSWVAKIHALCWVVSFQHVLLLDSDNIPVQDPAVLFNTPEYKSHGFLIWPDFWHNLWMEAAVYKLLNLDVPWEVNPRGLAAESGQVLIDRAVHADVLEWLWMLNAHSDIVYKCVVGDKDTFRMAFELAGKPHHYAQVPHPPQELLGDAGGSRNRFFHLGMGQASPDGKALMFLHRTARGKFFPWCAAKKLLQGHCQPAFLTLPVVQEQLQASVRDAGSMRFDADKIDIQWYTTACCLANSSCSGEVYESAELECTSSTEDDNKHHSGCQLQKRQQRQQQRTEGTSSSGREISETMHQDGRQLQAQQQKQNQQQQHTGDASSPVWVMPLPICNYTIGQLPIPALPVSAIPSLQEYLAALDGVFAEVLPLLNVQLVDRIKVMLGKL